MEQLIVKQPLSMIKPQDVMFLTEELMLIKCDLVTNIDTYEQVQFVLLNGLPSMQSQAIMKSSAEISSLRS